MALSLLQHIRSTQGTALLHAAEEMGLTPAQASTILDWTLPLVLAHLMDLNQRHGTGLVLALVNTQAVDGFWQTLDQTEWINQVQQRLNVEPLLLQLASDPMVGSVLAEILALVDAASLGEEGLNELLNGQAEHLQGQAPDWVWQQAGLTLLCGQAAAKPEPTEAVDLAAGIASLNQLVRQAAKQSQQPISESTMTSIDLDNHQQSHHDGHATEHPMIVLAPQRNAGGLTRIFEPVIALGILAVLYALFTASSARISPVAAPLTPIAITASSQETMLIPTIVADESELPPLDSGQPNEAETQSGMTDAQRAIAEAQRTGAAALQFSDNSL